MVTNCGQTPPSTQALTFVASTFGLISGLGLHLACGPCDTEDEASSPPLTAARVATAVTNFRRGASVHVAYNLEQYDRWVANYSRVIAADPTADDWNYHMRGWFYWRKKD